MKSLLSKPRLIVALFATTLPSVAVGMELPEAVATGNEFLARRTTTFAPLQDGSGSITLDKAGFPVSFTTPNGTTYPVTRDTKLPNPYPKGKTSYDLVNGNPVFVVESMGSKSNLRFSDFGAWAIIGSNFNPSAGFNGPSGPRLQYYATGSDIVTGNHLPHGQADYFGSYIGVIILGNNASNSGHIALHADFFNQSMSARLDGAFSAFHPTGSINPTGSNPASYFLTSSVGTSFLNVNGDFYGTRGSCGGPCPKETTGILTGVFNSTGQIAGSYGATRR